MLSHREKNILRSIDMMFRGMDDEVLKEVILATSLQKSEEEKERIIDIIKEKQKEDMKYFNEKFEIEINNTEPLKMIELFKTYVEQNKDLVEELERKADEEEAKLTLTEKQD
jgi:hypothetical protein